MDRAETIATLYRALNEHDGDTMAALYHPDARFSDPVFPDLRGEQVGMMWRMLCTRGKDLRVEHSAIAVQGDRGTAHWEAYYTFATTGRAVHNVIDAVFRFEGDRIIEHDDTFSLWRWSRQALGPLGRPAPRALASSVIRPPSAFSRYAGQQVARRLAGATEPVVSSLASIAEDASIPSTRRPACLARPPFLRRGGVPATPTRAVLPDDSSYTRAMPDGVGRVGGRWSVGVGILESATRKVRVQICTERGHRRRS